MIAGRSFNPHLCKNPDYQLDQDPETDPAAKGDGHIPGIAQNLLYGRTRSYAPRN